jgi:hypothetical protein
MWRLRLLVAVCLATLMSCAENNVVNMHLKSIDDSAYHEEEIIPAAYGNMYGKWKLVSISGGFSGGGYETDFDFLEMKSIGIYGLVRNDTLFEYGRIEVDTFDLNREQVLQIRLIPEWYTGTGGYWGPPEKYVVLDKEVMTLESPCCDFYNHHFRKTAH